MGNQIVKAVEDGAEEIGQSLGRKFPAMWKQAAEDVESGMRKNMTAHLENDAQQAAKFVEKDATGAVEKEAGSLERKAAGSAAGDAEHGLAGAGEGDAVGGKGVGGCGKTGEPVDVVGGQMVTARVDLQLPAVLPLVLRRAYASGYRHGGLFGAGFSSTLDIRVQTEPDEIVFADDDARMLSFPVPTRPGERVRSSAGPRLELSWDRETDLIRVLDRDRRRSYEFAPPEERTARIRPLTSIRDRCGNWITIQRDGGLPVEIRHAGGYRVAVDTAYTQAGFRIEALRLLDGANGGEGTRILGYQYDPRGRLIAATDSTGLPFCYDWDAEDRITAWTDRCGYQFRYFYDAAGRVERTEGDGGFLSGRFEYDPANRVTKYTDSLGRRTEHHYDARGDVVRLVDQVGSATGTEYDRYGQVIATIDPLGGTTRFTLDERGNTVRTERPDGTVAIVEYDEHDEPVRILGPDGAVWQYSYDESGNLVELTDPLGAITRYSYAERGRATGFVDPLGHESTIETDAAGLPLSHTDPLGSTWRVTRDPRGRIVTATDPLGASTTSVWSDEDLLISRTLPDGATAAWEYNENGALTKHTDPAGGVTVFKRGPFQRIIARTNPDGARYTFAHDTELRLLTVTNPQDATWTYAYDAAGHLTGETDFNGRQLRYEHDAAGDVVRRVNGSGQTIDIVRDPLGRILERRTDSGDVTAYEYDAAGELTRAHNAEGELLFTRDRLGRITTETFAGRTLTSTYDAVGRRLTFATASGRTTAWEWDAAGRPVSLSTEAAWLGFGHDAAGRESHRWLGADVALTSEWDGLGRLTTRRLVGVDGPAHSRTSRVLHERGWTYRADGAPTAATDSVLGTRAFALDALGRVTAVTAENWTETYAYDHAGNLTHAADSRTPDAPTAGDREVTGTLLRSAGRTTYEYDAQGRVIRTLRRTLSGRRTEWAFEYDAHDRLVRTVTPDGDTWRYGYDPLGRRVSKRRLGADGAPVEEYRFCWDGVVLAEQDHFRADTAQVAVTSWDYEPGGWTPVTQDRRRFYAHAPQEIVDRQFHAIVTDLVGTPTELVTPDGQIEWRRSADLWGNLVTAQVAGAGTGTGTGTGTDADAQAIDCPLRFPGQYHDSETGLDYNYFRYYDPATGRYTGPDVLGLSPALNHHAYINNPVIGMDALGLADFISDSGRNILRQVAARHGG
ncbi:MAG TPA: DUF6531 domain-containing protein, partial [Actinocrinis sp.]|nr:DUF6531 domain-containing protein [Actinocrinis sp.]